MPLRPARSLVGFPMSALRITEFSDVLCGHCAHLHETLSLLLESFPPGTFAIEPRHFPLDGTCNPFISRRGETPVRCTAAKAMICMEGKPSSFDFAGALFENQLPKAVDSQVIQQKFDPGAIAVLLFTQPREDTGKIWKKKLRAPYWAGRDRQI